MKTKYLVMALLLALLMQSCKEKTDAVTFRLTKKVTCEEIDVLFMGLPLIMTLCKDDLFITDEYEPMIVHYHLKERKADRFLSKGRGPGEAMPPVLLYANPFGDNKLYRHDKRTYSMGFYPEDSLSVFVPLFTLPYGYFNVIPFDTDRYLGIGGVEYRRGGDPYRYRLLDAESKVLDSFGDHPDFLAGEDMIPFIAKAMFHQADLANCYRRKKVVAASSYVLDIMDYSVDITKEPIKRVLLAPYDYDYAAGSGGGAWAQEKRGMVKGVSSVACDNTYIYLLFDHGFVREENIGVKKEVWVLDWEGEPVKKLILDADVRLIAADPYSDDQIVYGLAYESDDEDELYKIVRIETK